MVETIFLVKYKWIMGTILVGFELTGRGATSNARMRWALTLQTHKLRPKVPYSLYLEGPEKWQL
jgi:hypothetical protein